MIIIVIVIVIVIVKEPSKCSYTCKKHQVFHVSDASCMQLQRCVCRTHKKKKKQSLAITKKPCISSIFPPDLDKSFI